MITTPETENAVRRLAMDLLARREHGQFELARKLRQRGVAAELYEPVLARLVAEGLLSDARYLESMIRKRALAGYGPLRICEELKCQGLDRVQIQQALEESGFDWERLLDELWQRKFAGEVPKNRREQGRQARFLAYRGFSAEQVQRLWRTHAQR